ncbi:hypothetical protein [Streptomyces sp. NPDC006551]|uniref:hypothetical protein n=1 Tax=Streptomyces sp. NPDC006551 TaxID=3157178 RepID=UPI0033A89AA5
MDRWGDYVAVFNADADAVPVFTASGRWVGEVANPDTITDLIAAHERAARPPTAPRLHAPPPSRPDYLGAFTQLNGSVRRRPGSVATATELGLFAFRGKLLPDKAGLVRQRRLGR